MERPPDRTEIDEEIAFLERQLASLARDRKRLPWLLVLAALSPIAWALFGAWIGLGLLVGGLAFFLGGLYLTAGHASEYREKLERLERERRQAPPRAPGAARQGEGESRPGTGP